MGSASKTITISFDESGSTGPQDVTLTIKNVCTKAVIPNAVVTLTRDGSTETKTADVNGQVTFLQVSVGTWPITVTAAGYLDNATDTLANDAITV